MGSGAMSDEPTGPSRGDSYSPSISSDGRYITFGSLADDLTPDTPDAVVDVFRYDRQSSELMLASKVELPPFGRKSAARSFTVSADGRHLAYIVDAEIVVPPPRPHPATIVRDLENDTTTILFSPEWPPDNFYVGFPQSLLFAAGGDHLFIAADAGTQPADTNFFSHLRLFRRNAGTLTDIKLPQSMLGGSLLSRAAAVDLQLAVTPNGRFLAFQSPNAVSSYLREDVLVFDTVTETLTQASIHAASDLDTFGSSFKPAISDDGRWLAFESRSTNLIAPGAAHPGRKVLLHDRQTQTTVLVSSNQLGVASADRDSAAVALSADGNWSTFFSDADDLVPDDSNGVGDVFLRDNQSGEVRRISTHAGWNGQMARTAAAPVISPEGEWVLYQAPGSGVLLYHRSTDANTLITHDCETDVASMTPDGELVVFTARASSIDPASSIHARNVYVWNRGSGDVELITWRHPSYDRSLPGFDSHLFADGVSGDGSRFVFRSSARNLSEDQPDAYEALWVRDLTLGTNILIAVHDGNFRGSGPRPFSEAVISGDGRYIAYLSQRTNLPPEALALDGWDDVFVHNLETGQQYLVTESRSGSFAGSGSSRELGISQDGGRVSFTSEATNLSAEPGGALGLFVWDRESDSIQRMDDPSIGPQIHYCADQPPLLSPDGSKLAFIASNPGNGNCVLHLRGWNDVASTNINPDMSVRAFAWHADGTKIGIVGYIPNSGGNRIVLNDLVTGQTTVKPGVSLNWEHGFSFDPALAHVSYFSVFNVFAKIQIHEIETGQVADPSEQNYAYTHRESLWQLGTIISPDGRFVVFKAARSQAGATQATLRPENRLHLRVMDRGNGTISILDRSIHDGTVFDVPPGRFVMAPDVSRVFFESYQPDLVGRDTNLAMDIFAVDLISEDSDDDGMADDWEMAYFDTLDRDGSEDADGDTISDLGEYQAGTVPISSSSVLSVTEIRVVNTGERQLSWRSVTGKRYRVQMKPDVDAPDWLDRSGVIAATTETTSFTDSPEDGGELPANRYYRVVVVE